MPGPAVAIAGAGLASSAIGANAAKKAGEAQARSADAATNLQREIYTDTTERFKPYVEAGGNALQAMLFEMGLADRPVIGGMAPQIEEITTTTPGSGRVPVQPQGGDGNGMAALGLGLATPATTSTSFRVGDRTFETRSAAEEFAAANKTAGREYGGYTESPMFRYMMETGTDNIQGSAAARGGLFSGATLQALEDNRRELVSADTGEYFARLAGLTSMGLGAAGNQASAGAGFADSASQTMMAAGNARAQGRLGAAQSWQTGISDLAGSAGYFGWGTKTNPMAAYSAPTLFGGNSWGAR
jgi:hypothetical protein